MTDGQGATIPGPTQTGLPEVETSAGRSSHCTAPMVRQSAQGLVEYGLILFIVAFVCAVSLVFFGDQLSSLLQLITNAV